MKLKFKLFLLFALMLPISAFAQNVKWKYSSEKISEKEYKLIFSADIPMFYHMYSLEETKGPQNLLITFEESDKYTLDGGIETTAEEKEEFDKGFGINVKYYEGSPVFTQKVIINGETEIKGELVYQICTDGQCIPGDDEFSFKVGEPVKTQDAVSATDTTTPIKEKSNEGILWFFFGALLTGLASVFMPCVFPMIPMVISFFMSGSSSKGTTMIKGLIFCLSITLVYTSIGVIVGFTQNPQFAVILSTHWISNLIFFVLFIAFVLSFFGLFEITLPAGLANKADKQVDKGGYMASFFLAIVLAIVSFSCTGPFVGGILVKASMDGIALKTILGMAGFGFGLGLPFFVLSIVPSLLQKLPKSGGWLNTVKISFGFVLMALSLKFLDIAETSLGYNFITRDVFIAIWIVIAILLGLYLLGKIKFEQDSDVPHIGIFRLFLVVATFTFAVYLVPGLFGAPLSAVSAMLPAQQDQVFDLTKSVNPSQATVSLEKISTDTTGGSTIMNFAPLNVNNVDGEKIRHSEFLTLPKGVKGYFDLKQGLEAAKRENKPVLLDFKGHKCGNCKKMEAEVFVDNRVIEELNNNYIVIGLYTDDDTKLPENEWVTAANGKVRKTIGAVNLDYQVRVFGQVAQPYFIVVNSDEKPLKEGVGYISNPDEFLKWLQK